MITIAKNARLGFTMLQERRIDEFAELITDSWRMVNEVENRTVESVDILKKICGNDLIGHKIGGAGGGGFALAIFSDTEKKKYYKKLIKDSIPDCLIYDPLFGGSGMSIIQNTPGSPQQYRKCDIGKINTL